MNILIILSALVGSLTAVFASSNNFQSEQKHDAFKLANANSVIQEDDESIVSYISVLESYYDIAIGDNETPSLSSQDFIDNYYLDNKGQSILDYTLNIADENNNYSNAYYEIYGAQNRNARGSSSGNNGSSSTPGGSSEGDAYYILKKSEKDETYTSSTLFAKAPIYSAFDYSSVKEGDIVYETETILFNSGHNALIVDMEHNSGYGKYIQTIEAVGGGVQKGYLDDQRMVDYRCEIFRVVGRTDNLARLAISFSVGQLGKGYSLNPLRLNTDYNSNSWYCSELVYASWKYVGIDIGVKNDNYLLLGCLPEDIAASDNTTKISMAYYDYLFLSIDSKKGNDWWINVYNPASLSLSVYYNAKMCFFNDAKDWTGLSDVKEVTIKSQKTVTIKISTNWFATSITTSYIAGGYRVITYADALTADKKTLNAYTNTIKDNN